MRSALRSGLHQQRDRAQQRTRLDAARVDRRVHHDPDRQLTAWLETHGPRSELAALEAISVEGLLQSTTLIELSPTERLRRLAVSLERTLVSSDAQPRGWLALDRIYVPCSSPPTTSPRSSRAR